MDKFYIIGIRYNPQFGFYLSKTTVAKPKVNKASITAKFEEYGSSTSLRFSICPSPQMAITMPSLLMDAPMEAMSTLASVTKPKP